MRAVQAPARPVGSPRVRECGHGRNLRPRRRLPIRESAPSCWVRLRTHRDPERGNLQRWQRTISTCTTSSSASSASTSSLSWSARAPESRSCVTRGQGEWGGLFDWRRSWALAAGRIDAADLNSLRLAAGLSEVTGDRRRRATAPARSRNRSSSTKRVGDDRRAGFPAGECDEPPMARTGSAARLTRMSEMLRV
jgi:hypothetical protein